MVSMFYENKKQEIESICCSSIGSISWPFTQTVRSLSGNQLDFNRRPQSSTRGPGPAAVFGPTRTQQCDIVATDGIMHVVDRVMLPMGLRKIDTDVIIRRPYSEIMLTGF
ncbi:hypothetical protein AAG570_007147 [Ranatra chinensis]|uniref:FAS1 domain-containing protein n=1 Tax=Ranatra chinensis TaxID=642074 RepID=A0ABD0XV26_9HEMI